MERIAYTFRIMKASWEVLMKDKELLLYALLSGICCLLVVTAFALPMFGALSTENRQLDTSKLHENPGLYYGLTFLFYFITYFIIIFFNSAIVACAIFRLRGGDPTLKTGFDASLARLPQIIGWALVSATVGVVLRIIEDRSKRAGQIISGLLGVVWSVMTFLVVPILVVERKGPIEAVKESARLLKKTWGEQIIGNFSFGAVFFVFSLIGIVPFAVGLLSIHSYTPLGIALIAMAVLYWVALALVQSTLYTIFQAGMYLYAHDGLAPRGFHEDLFTSAMRPTLRQRDAKIFSD